MIELKGEWADELNELLAKTDEDDCNLECIFAKPYKDITAHLDLRTPGSATVAVSVISTDGGIHEGGIREEYLGEYLYVYKEEVARTDLGPAMERVNAYLQDLYMQD
jgi:hypothetical protein